MQHRDFSMTLSTEEVVIALSGEEAAKFLQAMTTNDLAALPEQRLKPAAICNPKGQLIAVFLVFRHQGVFYLIVHERLAEKLFKRLLLYRFRLAVEITWPTPLKILGLRLDESMVRLFGENGSPLPMQVICLSDGCFLLALSSQRYLLVGEAALLNDWTSRLQSDWGLPVLPQDHWRWLSLTSGWLTLTDTLSEKLYPQYVNLDLQDGVHFKKGCYPGQEVIARMHYLSKHKKRMRRYRADQALEVASWTVVCDADGNAIGEVLDTASSPDGFWDALVLLPIDCPSALFVGSVRLTGPWAFDYVMDEPGVTA